MRSTGGSSGDARMISNGWSAGDACKSLGFVCLPNGGRNSDRADLMAAAHPTTIGVLRSPYGGEVRALVIGIDAYRHVRPLKGAVGRCQGYREFLTKAGSGCHRSNRCQSGSFIDPVVNQSAS